ncbi:hypothetical protein AB1L42_23775 [Thalassoglobus sp. JC818]|uniref:hypothetical protein n=1 Tax=Thalassoglobus sp. JC818 TaxID=3232136 RepID=UPI003457BD59
MSNREGRDETDSDDSVCRIQPPDPPPVESANDIEPEDVDILDDDNLGSLAQSARSNHLKNARIMMYVLGTLMLIVSVTQFFIAELIVDNQIKLELANISGRGVDIDQQRVQRIREETVTLTKVVSVISSIAGVILLVLGYQVYNYPVPCTVLALVLYLGGKQCPQYLIRPLLPRRLLLGSSLL